MAGTNGDQPHAAIGKSNRVAQRLESPGLGLIRNHDQANIGRFDCTVDQLGQANVVGLANVDYRFSPRRRTAHLKCESGLANSRLSLDVQVKDVA